MYWEKSKNKSYYVIRGLRMANYLVRNGHDIVKVVDDKDKPEFKVFLFNDCYELRQAMENYK